MQNTTGNLRASAPVCPAEIAVPVDESAQTRPPSITLEMVIDRRSGGPQSSGLRGRTDAVEAAAERSAA